jgi:hypothetical protein
MPMALPRQLARQPRRTPRSISSFCLPLSRAALPRRRANATLGRGQSGQCGVVGIHRNCLRSWHCAGLRGLTGSVIVASGYLPGALRLAFAIDSTISGGRSVDHTESRTEQRTESARAAGPQPAPRRWPRCQEAGLGGAASPRDGRRPLGSGSDQTVAFPADQSGESGKLASGQRTVCAGHVPPVPGRRGGEVMRGAGAGGRGWAEFRWAVAAAAG